MPYFEYEPRGDWDSDNGGDSDDGDSTEDEFSSEIAHELPPTVDLTTEAGRREIQLDLRERLWVIEQRVRQLGIQAWSDDELDILDIPVRRWPELDLDETAPFDPNPLFFHPFPAPAQPAAFREFIRLKFDHEEQGAPWMTPCGIPWTHDGIRCADCSFVWYEYRLEFAMGKQLQWQNNASPGSKLCGCRHDERVSGNNFLATAYYRVADAAKPHVMFTVMNNEAPRASSGTILASELISACAAMQHQLRHAEFVDHHTIPILICSFYHTNTARFLQFHWDGSSLVIRQSRLLDLKGEEPTTDALLLLRWLGNTPTGQTEYTDVARSDEEHVHHENTEKAIAAEAVQYMLDRTVAT